MKIEFFKEHKQIFHGSFLFQLILYTFFRTTIIQKDFSGQAWKQFQKFVMCQCFFSTFISEMITFGVIQRCNRYPFLSFPIKLILLSSKNKQFSCHLHKVFLLQFLIIIFRALSAIENKYDFDLFDNALFGMVEVLIFVCFVSCLFWLLVHLFININQNLFFINSHQSFYHMLAFLDQFFIDVNFFDENQAFPIQNLKNGFIMKDLYFNFINPMHSKINDGESRFILPTGIATSGTQLKSLQQKLLQNYYGNHAQMNLSPHKSSKGLSTEAKSTGNVESFSPNLIQKEKYLNEYDFQAKKSNENVKNSLSSDLKAQMDYKNLKKQYQRHQNLEEEGKLIQHTHKFDSLQRQRIKQFNNKYKMEAQQDKQIKDQRKYLEANLQQHEKEFYRNRYSLGGFPRSESLGSLSKPQAYSNPTKQYYYEIEQAMRTREPSNFNNPEAMRRNSSFKITQNDERMQKLDNMYAPSLKQHYSNQSSMLQSFKNKQMRQRQDLKQVLLNQIREKQQLNRLQKRHQHEIPYTTKDYQFVHHPINNPVDFRHAHDNRYVIGELKSIK